jgi:RimJ/RimL family protein N-acetyltransferase
MSGQRFTSLRTERLVLRRFAENDLPALIAYRRDPEVARFQSWSALDEPAARAFLAALEKNEPGRRGEWFQFAIALRSTDQLIGDCALHVKSDDPQQAEIGYTLARAHQGQGYAQEAIKVLLDYVFRQLQIHRVMAQVDVRNQPSVILLERLGFRREGHFHQSYWLRGEWIDEYLYALLAAEWRDRRRE